MVHRYNKYLFATFGYYRRQLRSLIVKFSHVFLLAWAFLHFHDTKIDNMACYPQDISPHTLI